jgi:hypothetical protein
LIDFLIEWISRVGGLHRNVIRFKINGLLGDTLEVHRVNVAVRGGSKS